MLTEQAAADLDVAIAELISDEGEDLFASDAFVNDKQGLTDYIQLEGIFSVSTLEKIAKLCRDAGMV